MTVTLHQDHITAMGYHPIHDGTPRSSPLPKKSSSRGGNQPRSDVSSTLHGPHSPAEDNPQTEVINTDQPPMTKDVGWKPPYKG